MGKILLAKAEESGCNFGHYWTNHSDKTCKIDSLGVETFIFSFILSRRLMSVINWRLTKLLYCPWKPLTTLRQNWSLGLLVVERLNLKSKEGCYGQSEKKGYILEGKKKKRKGEFNWKQLYRTCKSLPHYYIHLPLHAERCSFFFFFFLFLIFLNAGFHFCPWVWSSKSPSSPSSPFSIEHIFFSSISFVTDSSAILLSSPSLSNNEIFVCV